ncbi:MAG: TylF/MycF/NovP-related O-methyltransferase [Planctomycetota bacterium]
MISPHNEQMGERTYVVRELVRSLERITGDTAEVGVFQGRTSFFIRQAREQGEHHAFDSFEGLSEPTPQDISKHAKAFRWKRGDLSVGEQLVRENLAGLDGVRLYRGWVPDRFEEVAEHQFAFVHIDVDLYQPTLDSVSFFYRRLRPGGMLVCDDYGFATCPGAYKAMHDFFDQQSVHIIHLSTGQGLVIKP